MKKISIILILIISIFSCDLSTCHHFAYNIDLEIEPNTEIIKQWVFDNIKPRTGEDTYDWQTPIITYTRRKGDCKDKTIFFIYLIKNYCNIDDITVQIGRIEGMEDELHVIALYDDGKMFDTYGIENKKFTVEKELTYQQALWVAEFER